MRYPRMVLTLVMALALMVPFVASAQTSSIHHNLFSLGAPLSGGQEVPGPGDPDGFGFARITINLEAGELCFRLSVAHIDAPTAAHIHEAPPGVAGPVVVPLAAPVDGLVNGCVSVDLDLAADIVNNPMNYYVNVHNAPFPAGALRGQLEPINYTPGDAVPTGPQIEVIAEGLDNPRHLNIGPDGMLYVAEAGSGGDQCVTGEGPAGPGEFCYGLTGAITSITTDEDDVSEEVASGFPSVAEPTGMFATGVHDVSLAADGTIYAVLGEAIEYDDPNDDTEIPGLSSTLVRINADGTWTVIADLMAYEAANNPDQGVVADEMGQPTDEPELLSNPYAVLAHDDGVYVIDAGANDLLRVSDDGTVSTYAVFSPQEGTVEDVPPFIPLPPDLPPDFTFPIQSVPTSITVGTDGAFYVGELTGFPFPVDRARVWRVMDENGDGDALDEGETTVFATGFTNIIDVDVAPDGTLYVLEFARQGLLAAEGSGGDDEAAVTGALVRVNADGSNTEVASTGLILPGGLEINADGDIFVSNFSVFPGVGQVDFPETGQVVQVILATQ